MSDIAPIVAELEALRAKADRTVYAIAKEADVSPQATAALLGGSGYRTLVNLEALGEALGYRLTWAKIRPPRK